MDFTQSKEKIKYLIEINNYEKKGFFPQINYNINSDLNDIKLQYEILKHASDIKIKETLIREINEFKKFVKDYPISYDKIDINTNLEIIERIHKTFKSSYASADINKKVENLISNVFLADKLIEKKYNISFIGGLLTEFNNTINKNEKNV